MALAIGGGFAQPLVATAAPAQEMALTQYVNTLIGTSIPTSSGYQGNVAPGAQVPFGMVNFGPDMPRTDYNGSGGYKLALGATSGTINFFSLTHLNGPGCPGGGVVGMMPASTPKMVTTTTGTGVNLGAPVGATYQTSTESVRPGYYGVTVNGVQAEFTSTARTGMARFTYPDKDSGYYSLDARLNGNRNRNADAASGSNGPISAANVALQVSEDGKVLTGKTVAPAFCTPYGTMYNSNVYFYAEFDKPLREQTEGSTVNTVVNGASLLQYDLTDADPTLTMRVGISSVSVDNAKLNLETENPSSTFDQVAAAADADWNARLNTVQIDQAADPDSLTSTQRDNLVKFYTALYRVFVSPTIYSDVNGDYRGMDQQLPYRTSVDRLGSVPERSTFNLKDDSFTRLDGTTGTPKAHYSGLSMWDTYRSAAQALTLFAPEVASDVMQSLVADAEQCGAFPHWVDGSDDSTPMAGDNALAVLAASYAFGARDFDLKTAARYVKQSVFDPTSNCNNNASSPNLTQYLDYGYRPTSQGQSASNNLERNAADHAAGMFLNSLPAQVLWDSSVNITDADIAKLNDRSTWWKNIFNRDTGKLAGRLAPTTPGTLGTWVASANSMFHETTEPNYFWAFGYAWPDLIDLIGEEAALTRLNTLFSLDDALTATPTEKQLNGGQSSATLYIGNEPALPIPWAYNWVGKPDATQYIIPKIMSTVFKTSRDGLPGNDDYGTTSAWYVFAALGMFPVAQAHGGLALSTPQFPAMTVHFGDNTLRIETDADPATSPFIDSMTINGQAQEQSYVTLDKLLSQKNVNLSYNLRSTATSSWATGDPVGPATSATSLSLSASGQAFDATEPETATATVIFSDGASQPGKVEFRSGLNLIGTAALGKGGTATVTIPAASPVGTHSLTATFVPDNTERVGASTSAVSTFVVTTASVTDKSVLQSVYDAASVLSNTAGLYTEASWSALQAKITAAATVLADVTATQAQADSAVKELGEALAGLTVAPDKSVLQSAYDAAATLSNTGGTYTAASWSAMQAQLEAANTVLGDSAATQAAINAAATALNTALAGLVVAEPVPDKAVLQAVYNSMSMLSSASFTAESWSPVLSSLGVASSVLANGSATQIQIDAAVTGLTAAVSALVVAPPAPDKSVLQSVYGSLLELSNASGAYTEASWSTLQAAMVVAKDVLDGVSPSQAQINAAMTGLAAAVAGLAVAPKAPDKSVLQSVYNTVNAMSNASGTYTSGSWNTLQTRAGEAKAVLDNASATQAQIDAAVTALTTAMSSLVAAPPAPDKSVLLSVYNSLDGLASAGFTAASWSALQVKKVAAKAVLDNAAATQAQIDTAVKELTAAVSALVVAAPTPDKSVLQSVYDGASGLSSAGYTSASWSVLQTKLAAAKVVLDNASAAQAQIDAAAKELTAAVSALVVAPPAPDKSVLRSVYDTVNKLSSAAYTPASWSALQAKKAAAKVVLDNASATQAQINAAVTGLSTALAGLVAAPPKAVVAKVKLNQSQLRLVKGKSITLEDAVYYTNSKLAPAYAGKTTWKSSNTKVATVSSNGVVKAKKAGTVTITVTSKEVNASGKKLSASVKVTVVKSKPKSKVTKVTASVPKTMKVGQVVYITGKYSSSKATGVKVSYSTSKPEIVLIDKAGRMVAASKGTEYVKVKAGGKTKSYKITVK